MTTADTEPLPEHELADLQTHQLSLTISTAPITPVANPTVIPAPGLPAWPEQASGHHGTTQACQTSAAAAASEGSSTWLLAFETRRRALCTLARQHVANLVGWFAIISGFVLALMALVPAFVSKTLTEKQYRLDKWQALMEFFDYCKAEKVWIFSHHRIDLH
ncbi:hypothetical protein LIA77_08342 [Sarocladium implicatum]|nr:hypothetical protein LIA77_08342 [Sarocladium implicatum]